MSLLSVMPRTLLDFHFLTGNLRGLSSCGTGMMRRGISHQSESAWISSRQ
jgi:hypothetical protein